MSLPNDPDFSKLWYLKNTGQAGGLSGIDIKADQAWDKLSSSRQITVAILDTGVQIDHPDLKDNVWKNNNEIPNNGIDDDHNGYIDDINGWDFVRNGNSPIDLDGHGTHVAGIIGASNSNNLGTSGIALGSPIMAVKVLPSDNEKVDTSVEGDSLGNAIRYAVNNGAKIINLSLGGPSYSSTEESAVAYAASKGSLLVVAAGNDNANDEASIGWPANFKKSYPKNILIVGSANNLGKKSNFSNFGDSIDIFAPGGTTEGVEEAGIYSTYIGSSYQFLSGTSMAAPVVSGAAADVWSVNPNWNADTVIKILQDSARTITDLKPYAKQPLFLDLNAAMSAAQKLSGSSVENTLAKNLVADILTGSPKINQNSYDAKFYNLGGGRYGVQQKGKDTIDEITGVTSIQFNDQSISVANDVAATFNQIKSKDDVTGVVYRLYNAAFTRLPDAKGLENWINGNKSGSQTYGSTALEFSKSQEFKNRYGSDVSDTQYITTLYNNVLGRSPDTAGLANYQSLLAGGKDRGSLLLDFSESPENQTIFTKTTGLS